MQDKIGRIQIVLTVKKKKKNYINIVVDSYVLVF